MTAREPRSEYRETEKKTYESNCRNRKKSAVKDPGGHGYQTHHRPDQRNSFNMLQTYIPDCVFVDIFSGSGGIGIEALSRGARKAYFIENAPKALACIEDNLAFTKMKDRAIVLKQDACAGLTGIYENM